MTGPTLGVMMPCPTHGNVAVAVRDVVLVRCPDDPPRGHVRFQCPGCVVDRRCALTPSRAVVLLRVAARVEVMVVPLEWHDPARSRTDPLGEDEVIAACRAVHAAEDLLGDVTMGRG